MANIFTPRTTAPDPTDLHWIQTSHGGYNSCILGYPSYATGSVLSNCTGYRWGRFLEENGLTTCNLSINQASIWYLNTADGYQRGQTPKLGAVICWDEVNQGSGHVAIVERINVNTLGNVHSIVISESVYGGTPFRIQTIYPPNYTLYTGMTFQGFIYPQSQFDPLPISEEELICIIKKRRRYY